VERGRSELESSASDKSRLALATAYRTVTAAIGDLLDDVRAACSRSTPLGGCCDVGERPIDQEEDEATRAVVFGLLAEMEPEVEAGETPRGSLDFGQPSEDDSPMDGHQRRGSNLGGYLVVLVGAVGFVVRCFLPYLGGESLLPMGGSVSLYRLTSFGNDGLERLGGLLYLFAGAATVGVIALAGIGRPREWTRYALVAGTAAWTLTWIGILITRQNSVRTRWVTGRCSQAWVLSSRARSSSGSHPEQGTASRLRSLSKPSSWRLSASSRCRAPRRDP
jgi:hypothetical protein